MMTGWMRLWRSRRAGGGWRGRASGARQAATAPRCASRREEGPGGNLGCRGPPPRPGRRAAFKAAYGAKFPKAGTKITDDLDQLLAFYDYPAEHWVHLRTTNPIESTFATVRHRTKVPGSRAAGLAMAFKLIESAQDRWRMVNAPHLVALVRAGATFISGKLVERPGEETQEEAA
jgi:hypothetical protein